jgi:hypothetical protein
LKPAATKTFVSNTTAAGGMRPLPTQQGVYTSELPEVDTLELCADEPGVIGSTPL